MQIVRLVICRRSFVRPFIFASNLNLDSVCVYTYIVLLVMDKDSNPVLQVKCGNKVAEFYPAKCVKLGKSIAKCIKYNGRWVNPPEFESSVGMHGRKWKSNIKFQGFPIGQWLAENNYDTSSQQQRNLEFDKQPVTIQGVNDDHTIETRLSPGSDSILSEHGRVSGETCTPCSQGAPRNVSQETNSSSTPSHITELFSVLEKQLSLSLRSLISETFRSLKEHVESEFVMVKQQLQQLSERVRKLEVVSSPSASHTPPGANSSITISDHPPEKIECQMA